MAVDLLCTRSLTRVAAVVVAGALLGSCGDEESTSYDDRVEREFLGACTAATPADVCRCLYERIVDEIPFERFEEIDRDLRDPAKLPDDVAALAVRCATEAGVAG